MKYEIMRQEEPLVSVIIPVYNGEQYLAEAIKSVFTQSYSNWELLVVDDGSTDKSAEIVEALTGACCIRQENKGVSAARNIGIKKAKGKLLAFLDSDDVWLPEKLSVQTKFMMEHSEIGFSITHQKIISDNKLDLPDWFDQLKLTRPHPGFVPSTLMVRKDVMSKVGGFDPNYSRGEDTEWILRAKDSGTKMHILKEVLLKRRFHLSNVSLQSPPDMKLLMRFLKQSIDRQKITLN